MVRRSAARSAVCANRSRGFLASSRRISHRTATGSDGLACGGIGRIVRDDRRQRLHRRLPLERVRRRSSARRASRRARTGPTGSRPCRRAPVPGSCRAPSRRSARRPSVCASAPPTSAASPSCDLARPKSTIFTRPSAVTITFSGFRSRWTMPASCAAARPSAICCAISTARRSGMRPRFISIAQRSPSISSDTRYGVSPSTPTS